MPTAIRTKREKLRDICKAMDDAFYANLKAAAPKHIKKRLDQPPSQFAENLAQALSLKGTVYNGVGRACDEETGELVSIPDGLGASVESNENRESQARDIRARYQKIWKKRGAAKEIAEAESLTPRCIQRYMKDFP